MHAQEQHQLEIGPEQHTEQLQLETIDMLPTSDLPTVLKIVLSAE